MNDILNYFICNSMYSNFYKNNLNNFFLKIEYIYFSQIMIHEAAFDLVTSGMLCSLD